MAYPAALFCFAAALAAGLSVAGRVPAMAQVLEIAPGGAVTRYDGPTVYTEAGATPIASTPSPPGRRRGDIQQSVNAAANAAALSPELVEAVAWRESGLRSDRVSVRGAVGVMQLMPATARALGVDPADKTQNLRGGAGYLSQLMRRYDGDLLKTLAAYNAGPGAVDRYGGTPPYPETRAYVNAVLERLSQAVAPLPAARSTR
jgi:soluble lytic murein transglycosylase-like protein